MRTAILLLSLAVIAACSDRDQLTSPAAARPVAGTQAVDATQPQAAVGTKPDAKPTGPVAFTKTQIVQGTTTFITVGDEITAYADCPAGTFITGGGHVLETYQFAYPPLVRSSGPTVNANANFWSVVVDTQGHSGVKLHAFVICAS